MEENIVRIYVYVQVYDNFMVYFIEKFYYKKEFTEEEVLYYK